MVEATVERRSARQPHAIHHKLIMSFLPSGLRSLVYFVAGATCSRAERCAACASCVSL
jgi:hypothetical protein